MGAVKSVLFGVFSCFTLLPAAAKLQYNLPVGVTEVSRDIFGLHMLILYICVVIAVLVFGVMLYSIVKHRKSQGAKAANFHDNTVVEIIWTIVPFVILILIAIPATTSLLKLENTDSSDMVVKVTGYQWKWEYDYLDKDISFFSNLAQTSREAVNNDPTAVENYLLEVDRPLVVPVDTKVQLLLTSNDVIHSWWVPDLGVKQDAIPGFINDTWFRAEKTGVYRGQCAELCGKDHGFMPIVVEVVSQRQYDAWIKEQYAEKEASAADSEKIWNFDELMVRGEQVYQASCAACHGVTGAGIPGVFPPITKSLIARSDQLDAHIDIVMHGKAGSAMQAFAKQLSDADIAAVITYERNALGNTAGDMVQPADIQIRR